MSLKAVKHGLAERNEVFYGTPTTLPRVLFCAASTNWCGWHRTANTPEQYAELVKERTEHEKRCAVRAVLLER